MTADPHRYELVEPPERLDAESIGAAVKQAVRGASGDVVIVHVVSHAEQWRDDVRVVGADGRATPESSVRSWLDYAYGDDRPAQINPDLGETGSGRPCVLFLLDLAQAGGAGRQPGHAAIADEHRRVWTIAATGADESAFNAHLTPGRGGGLARVMTTRASGGRPASDRLNLVSVLDFVS